MSETKSPKVRLYKYATEINLSSENLIEFLKTKGHEVKSHQSILSEEMIVEINAHFKKDIEKAEQHYKKIAEFNNCLLYTSPSPRDRTRSRMPYSA
mgnify:CR=1 FL=1